MHEGTANCDDVSHRALEMNFAKLFMDLFVFGALDGTWQSSLIADLIAVAEFLLELIFRTHELQQ